ncbi:PEP-CTERM sorting domain-containing protein [Aeoliella sp.]|uniref:PEP-CTERM sorting domain-containing protein n=1 Tax=Aeoliella sp. TaxID=2795800 RepID=UPI003CCC2802
MMIRLVLLHGFCLVAFVNGVVHASSIYEHDFTGSDADPLNGVAVEGGSGAGTPWEAEAAWFADGHAVVGVDGFDAANAFLPFTPLPNRTYTLSATLTATGDTFNYMTLGFMNNPTVDTLSDQAGGPWLLKRGQQANFVDDIYSALDSTANGVGDLAFHGAFPGATNLAMQLDTSDPTWTVEFFIDGASVRGPEAIDTVTTPITHVGISRYVAPITGTAAEFRLSVVPEPSTVALLLLGCVSWVAFSKRSTCER